MTNDYRTYYLFSSCCITLASAATSVVYGGEVLIQSHFTQLVLSGYMKVCSRPSESLSVNHHLVGLTTWRRVQKVLVQCGWVAVPRWLNPRSMNLAFGTWNVISLEGSGSGSRPRL